ncbi:hypothetical protein ACHAXR_005607 [Thalassiosira sp. AJA248-18]
MPNIPNIPSIDTRSVRLLMAGHIEQPQSTSPDKRSGYIIQDLPPGQFSKAQVYGFTQQVDLRLPTGNLGKGTVNEDINQLTMGKYGDLDYTLHSAVKEEEELAQELGMDWMKNLPQEDFEKIVTSGVESKALLNDHIPQKLESIYPVSLVADPTNKMYYYVVLLASGDGNLNVDEVKKYLNVDPTVGQGSSQRSWTDFHTSSAKNERYEDDLNGDHFGKHGRPNYGSDYRVIVKKMSIGEVDPMELTDAEKVLAASSYDSGELIAMRHDWMQEFEPSLREDVRPAGLLFVPSGNVDGDGDALILVGTTSGRGGAFGTMDDNVGSTGADASPREDLDGFIMKIRTDDGNFAGRNKFDSITNQFLNTYSLRIKSNPLKNDIVAGVCSKPLHGVGVQEKMTHVYVVGSTGALLPGISSDTRNREFTSLYDYEVQNDDNMEAFLMKIDLATMNIVWTVQVGAFVDGEDIRGDVLGYGCAVTRDGQDVYLTGLVKENGVVTDFSEADYKGVLYKAEGGTDFFVSSYKTSDGSRNFLKQVGSTRDDFPSRGNGGITTDRLGNAIITGNTRGSLMRKRDKGEFRYGESSEDAASDVFVMSFERATANHAPIASDGIAVPAPRPVMPLPTPANPLPVNPPPVSAPSPAVDTISASANEDEIEKKNSALVSVVAIALAFIVIFFASYGVIVYRIKTAKNRENEVLMHDNLHGSRRGSAASQSRRLSGWGMHRKPKSAMNDFGDLNIMVEVRNSASGGWHGVYDDEQLQAIDFGVPTGTDKDDVVEQSLFMEDGLKEIEDSLQNYEIGDMDDVSDEDLIRAYNDAMALDIEPENPDVEFAMQGIGSDEMQLDPDRHEIS